MMIAEKPQNSASYPLESESNTGRLAEQLQGFPVLQEIVKSVILAKDDSTRHYQSAGFFYCGKI